MSRRRRASKRSINPDARYGSVVVSRFISTVMSGGKKSTAENIIYGALEVIREKSGTVDPIDILQKAVDTVKPRLEVKSRRVGGATYQVPMEVPHERQHALAMRWMINFARARKGVPTMQALASEIYEASQGQGNAIKKRDDVHKMAQANKAFAHLRF
ncbi:MAG: 30S ribosomal protein S7 [Verrucomicrobiota bacterium]|nr:30S ribosomal protein S7 [Verrucomicrobiota bacterium]